MMSKTDSIDGILLGGLDGSNPLGFLAAVGIVAVASDEFPDFRMGWKQTGNGWCPILLGCGNDEMTFSESLLKTLQDAPMTIFDIDKKMPFDAVKFTDSLKNAQLRSHINERRDADILVGMGTEMYPDAKTNQFQDSKLRMVRSGDSNGQGLPFYAKTIRSVLDINRVHHALFKPWDYQDEGYSLRWDPIGDQRYALRWREPNKSKLSDGTGLGTMLAADCLATEAFRLFPTLAVGRQAQTAGFHQLGRRQTYFVWPIWTPMVGLEIIRSLIALPDLHDKPLDYAALAKKGIPAVYRSQRIQQNQYYSNFSPAQPV